MADAITKLCLKRLAWKAALSADELSFLEADKAAWANEETKA